MRETFVEQTFADKTMKVIEQANSIIAEYQALGFTLTLRQLYYQFVSRDLLANKQSEYKRLGSIINNARLAGLIDWSAIEDRTRNLETHDSWASPADIILGAAQGYAENPWRDQDHHVEVWIEKDALTGVIEPVCNRWRLPYFACRGYTSQSEQYSAGKRLRLAIRKGKAPIILHLGDHDPSGLDMTRDNSDRLIMFARSQGVDVRRLALNFDQVQAYDPPPNPAKETDSRSGPYIQQYGESSWELDALDPPTIDALIDTEVRSIVNQETWDAALAEEEKNRELLHLAHSRWDDVEALLAEEDDGGDDDEVDD